MARGGQRAGAAALLSGVVASQTGAALAATVIPLAGPFATVAIRQLAAAIALLAVARPRLRGRRPAELLPVLALGLVMGVMNNAVYLAIERLGVGLSITLEYLGPLAIIVAVSRRLPELAAAALAAGGVALLAAGPVRLDAIGLLAGLCGAAAWAAYILLNRRIGGGFPGFEGSALAASVTALVFAPIGLATLGGHVLGPRAVAVGAIAGVLSSAIPMALDMVALRRIPPQVYGLLMSANPAVAALAGWVVDGERLHPLQWVALGAVTAASAIALGRPTSAPSAPPVSSEGL